MSSTDNSEKKSAPKVNETEVEVEGLTNDLSSREFPATISHAFSSSKLAQPSPDEAVGSEFGEEMAQRASLGSNAANFEPDFSDEPVGATATGGDLSPKDKFPSSKNHREEEKKSSFDRNQDFGGNRLEPAPHATSTAVSPPGDITKGLMLAGRTDGSDSGRKSEEAGGTGIDSSGNAVGTSPDARSASSRARKGNTLASYRSQSSNQLPTPSQHAPTQPARGTGGLLLRLFKSECFDSYFHMFYLFHRMEQGVHDYLVNLLYRRPDEEIHFYLPQLCQLAICRTESSLPRFLLDKSARSMHLALKGSWLLQAALEDRIPDLSETAKQMREEMEMAVVNSKPPGVREGLESSSLVVSDRLHKAPDLFLRKRVLRMIPRSNKNVKAYCEKAANVLLRYFPPSDSKEEKEITIESTEQPSLLALSTIPQAQSASAPIIETDGALLGPPDAKLLPPPSVEPVPVGLQEGKKKRKGKVSSGFITTLQSIKTEGSKVRIPSAYLRLGTPFVYSSFSRESYGSLLDDQEMQQFIIKQRRCEYFNSVGIFVNLLIELSDKAVLEPDKERRTHLVQNCLRSLDEWLFCRRSIVAASEGIFAMTGLVVPLTSFGVEPDRAQRGGDSTPFLIQPTPTFMAQPPQFSSVQIVRINVQECKVFSSKKRAPFLLVFELADLDEDLHHLSFDPSTERPATTGYGTSNSLSTNFGTTVAMEARPFDPIIDDDHRGRSAGEVMRMHSSGGDTSKADITWQHMTVFEAIVTDLKNRELYIPPYLHRPLNYHELSKICDPELEIISCEDCVPHNDSNETKPENFPELAEGQFPFACRSCGGTRLFAEAIDQESLLQSVRRSLGVVQDRNREGYQMRVCPNVPDTRPKTGTLVPQSPPPPADSRRRRSIFLKQIGLSSSQAPNSARSLSTGRSTPVDSESALTNVADSAMQRSTSIPPIARDGDSIDSGTKKSPGATNSLSTMLAFGRAPHRRSPSRTLTPQRPEQDSGSSMMPSPASQKTIADLLPLQGESPESQASRIRRIVWGELWDEKRERLRKSSPFGHLNSWQLGAVLVKAGDDLRQELLASQLTRMFKAIFDQADLPLWLKPYEVLVTGANDGILEFVGGTQSIDAIKKKFRAESIAPIFEAAFADNIHAAKKNFIESHAAYSLVSYFLQVRDRHNGNLLLTANGRIVHIDYGFMIANSPGIGLMVWETSPFKLSTELLAIMDGENSENFEYFKELLIKGFLEARKHADRIFLLVEMMLSASKMPCFNGAPEEALMALKQRFMIGISNNECMSKVIDLVDQSVNNWRTQQYDNFQRITNGIF